MFAWLSWRESLVFHKVDVPAEVTRQPISRGLVTTRRCREDPKFSRKEEPAESELAKQASSKQQTVVQKRRRAQPGRAPRRAAPMVVVPQFCRQRAAQQPPLEEQPGRRFHAAALLSILPRTPSARALAGCSSNGPRIDPRGGYPRGRPPGCHYCCLRAVVVCVPPPVAATHARTTGHSLLRPPPRAPWLLLQPAAQPPRPAPPRLHRFR